MNVIALKIKIVHPSENEAIDDYGSSLQVCSIGGSSGGRPLRVPILSF